MDSIYHFQVSNTDGTKTSLETFCGQVMLIVNTASKCGFTPQLAGLEELYKAYKDKGFVVLGFPCSQFGNQEFDDIGKTMQFCRMNYGVTFPMFAKVDVNGHNADPLFRYLKQQKKGLLFGTISWNFTKFLVDRKGQVVKRFAPTVKPQRIEKELQKLLNTHD